VTGWLITRNRLNQIAFRQHEPCRCVIGSTAAPSFMIYTLFSMRMRLHRHLDVFPSLAFHYFGSIRRPRALFSFPHPFNWTDYQIEYHSPSLWCRLPSHWDRGHRTGSFSEQKCLMRDDDKSLQNGWTVMQAPTRPKGSSTFYSVQHQVQ